METKGMILLKKLHLSDKFKKIVKKTLKTILCIVLTVCILLSAAALGFTAYQKSTQGDASMLKGETQKAFSTEFHNVVTYPKTKTQGRYWRDGMIGGNGRLGFVTSGAPYSDTIIYQDVDYIMPTDRDRDYLPDLTGDLEKTRQAIVNLDQSWNVADCKGWNYGYSFHPGQQLRLTQEKNLFFKDYIRWTDYETGEVGVSYRDKNGTWERATFTSRADDVTITKITESSEGSKINLTLSLDDASGMYKFGNGDENNMQYKKLVDDNCEYISFVAHYPDYELSSLGNGGYAGVTYIIAEGGSKEKVQLEADKNQKQGESVIKGDVNPAVKITDADAVYLITKNDRSFNMCPFEEFEGKTQYALVDSLLEDCRNAAKKYTENGKFDYQKALKPSADIQAEMFNRVSFTLGGDENKQRALSNEDLLFRQKLSGKVNEALIERFYSQARYAMICSSGYSMTRLSGMWTGEFNPGWRSDYTMDANVNLQSSGMNTSNLSEFGEGYIRFILRQIDDWKINAEKIYGMKDAIQTPVHSDGDGALNAEYYQGYPFQYWNAGASWMIQPIYEMYECFGNISVTGDDGKEMKLLEDVLLPLLTLQSNFWDQLVTPEYYTDKDGNARYEKGKTELKDGEKYLLIPSYSPENSTGGEKYNSTMAANSAMDIGAAKSGLEMTIDVENAVKSEGYEKRVEHWTQLLNNLPDYSFDDSGAVKEWCANQYEDNNKHRHISHLYCAWPLNETQHDEQLANAVLQAIENREKENSASHGFVHQALVLARLKQGDRVNDLVHSLLKSNICYDSLMTDHNTNRGSDTYCTDTELGMAGIINESLVYSEKGEIELLPALPSDWTQGEISGLRARTAAVVSVKWENGKATAQISSDVAQSIKVSCAGSDAQTVELKAGETKTLEFNF